MAYSLPVGFSMVSAAPAAAPGATNQYGFAPGSLNFQPASDFAAAPKVTAPVTPVIPAAPVSAIPTPVSAPSSDINEVVATQPKELITPAVQPTVAPKFTLPTGFSFKAPATPAPAPGPAPAVIPPATTPAPQPPVLPTPAPAVIPPATTPAPQPPVVAKPIATPAPTPAPVTTPGPVAPPSTPKAPAMTTTLPKPAPIDPRTAALINQGYTQAQITAAGGPAALLAKVNAPKGVPASQTTAAVNYAWADLNKAVTALQNANPAFSVQGMPVTKWSTAGVASLAKTDPAIFKALQAYLPKY